MSDFIDEIRGDYIIFHPYVLSDLLKLKNPYDVLDETIKYIDKNYEKLNKVKAPTSYMKSITIDAISNLEHTTFTYCKDIDLLIVVLAKTVSDLYIPTRDIKDIDELVYPKIYALEEFKDYVDNREN